MARNEATAGRGSAPSEAPHSNAVRKSHATGGRAPGGSTRRERSHEQIVRAASRLIREQGLDGAPVDEVMAAAGLTRGGFYAHFPDKTEMIVEALGLAFDQAKRNLFGADPGDGDAWLTKANARYLSEAHVAETSLGCALAALGGQIPRAPQRVRESFARHVDEVVELVAAKLAGGRPSAAARREATRVLAQWVGALTLARAFSGTRSAEILEIGRAAVAPDAVASTPRRAVAERGRATAAITTSSPARRVARAVTRRKERGA